MRFICVLDTETGGLRPDVDELLDVAVLRLHPLTLAIEAEFATKVRPRHPERIAPEASAKNGYSAAAWEGAMDARAALERVHELTRGCVLAGHNVRFDEAFVNAACARLGLPPLAVHHHRIDTGALGWPLLHRGQIPSLSLDAICAHLGVTADGAHTAHGDVHRTREVLSRLLTRYVGGDVAA